MKWLVMVALALLAFAPGAGAQEVVTEEIEVIVWGLPAFLEHDCPIDDRGRIQTYAPLVVTWLQWGRDLLAAEGAHHLSSWGRRT